MTGSAETRARELLARMRETPMCRGALTKPTRRVRTEIARVLAARGVDDVLARRVAFQLVMKIDADELADPAVRASIGDVLRQEVARLANDLGLGERQIVAALPKLSPAEVEDFLDELTRADRRIARTVFDAAIFAADPPAMGRRYLAEYRNVEKKLQSVEPTLARTLANATFKAGVPFEKALQHVERFLTLIANQKDHPDIASLLARAGLREK